MASAEGKNFEAIVKAKEQHNKNCPFPPHTVRMNPFEIERMQWEEGDTIAGLVLEADGRIGTGSFRLVCDGMEPPELDIEESEAIRGPAEPLVVPVGPSRPYEDEEPPAGPRYWRTGLGDRIISPPRASLAIVTDRPSRPTRRRARRVYAP